MTIRLPRTFSAFTALLLGSTIYSLPTFAQTQNEAATNANDEIVVTGSILSATTNENLVGVSVLTSEELQRRMSGSLGETLKFEPGISSSFFGAGASRPIIRGQGGLRVLLLDNGIGSIDASAASPDHAGAVEPAMASRIEVIRGSGLLRYGSAASGGVVNVIDGRIPEKRPSGTVTGSARIGVSSVDSGYETALASDISLGTFGNGDLVAHAELSHRKTDDYNIPGFARSKALRSLEPGPEGEEDRDTLSNSATKSTSIAAGASYISDRLFFGTAIKDLNSEYGVPGGEGSRIELDQTRYDFTSKLEFTSGPFEKLSVSGGAANYEHKEFEASGEIGTVFTNEGFEGRAEIVQQAQSAWQAAHGIQYKKRDFSAIGAESFVPPTTTNLFGIFSFHEVELGDLHLEAAGRYENVKHKDNTGRNVSFNGLSGSLGVDYHLTETAKLGGSFYRTERAPASEELFSNGPHLATNQFELGNANLDMETATGAEISLRYDNGSDHLTVNVFYTDYSDYIYEAITGETFVTDEGDTLPISRFTPSDAVFKGFEIDIGKTLGTWRGVDITADASLEYVKARLSTAGNTPLPRIPPLGAAFGVNADTGNWSLRAELEYAAKQDDLAFGELVSPSYALLNAFATYNINDNVIVRLSAHNLTDQDARQHTSFLKENVPLPGRNFKASLAVDF